MLSVVMHKLNVFKWILLLTITVFVAHTELHPLDRYAKTVYYYNNPPNAYGDYHFEFQTTNGITTKSAGNAFGSSGVVQFVSLEGFPITMTYVADADGYHPSGINIKSAP